MLKLGRLFALMMVLNACALPPAPPPRPSLSTIIPRTGVADVDAVIAAMLSNNMNARIHLWQPLVAGCTKRDGLGGPPKCEAGEAEGTPVEFLPVLGPGEGGAIRRPEADQQFTVVVTMVYGVYRVKADATRESEYPAGEFALLFTRPETDDVVTVRVQNGRIARMDYEFLPVDSFEIDGETWLIKPD